MSQNTPLYRACKRLLAWLLSCVYVQTCRFLPPHQKRIVFFSYPDCSDNSWHLYRFLAKELQGYQLVWLTQHSPDSQLISKVADQVEGTSNQIRLVKRWSLRGITYFIRAHLVFHTHGTYFFVKQSRSRTLINLWHGMPIKAIAYLDGQSEVQVAYSDYVLATSVHFQKIMANAFSVPLHRSLITGLPRNDVLLNVSVERRQEVFARIDLPVSAKLIVWLPTYRVSTIGGKRRDASSEHFLDELPTTFLQKLDQLASASDVSIIIKLHPMDYLNEKRSSFNFNRISFYSAAQWQALDIELYELLACSDALVSDISSVIIDYLLRSQNVGVLSTSLQSYSRDTVIDLEQVRNVTLAIESPEDFLRVLSLPVLKSKASELFHSPLDMNHPMPACQRIKDYFFPSSAT